MRIRHFGLLLLFMVGVVPLVAAGYYSIERANRTTVEAIRVGNERVAVRAGRRLAAYAEAELETLRAVAVAMAPAVKASPDQAERVVKNADTARVREAAMSTAMAGTGNGQSGGDGS